MRSWSAPHLPRLPGTPGTIRLFDTSSGEIRRAPAATGQQTARLYVCGITPYDATHLGHAATYVTFDLLGRLWRDTGLQVTYVQNITDVDEPLLERAERDGVTWQDLAAREIDLFREDMEALRVIPPEHYIGAVEGIPDDVEAVQRLVNSGIGYQIPVQEEGADGADVYLDAGRIPDFGAVSGWTREQMLEVFAERGGDPDRSGKRDPLDPLLWRAHRPGEPSWDGGATLGPGRPGWHIECTTIALRYLGTTFDVQGGGTDLIFPHHEMSATQAVALTGKPFADSYVHQAMVGLEGEKMSKSKGNLVLVSALRRAGIDPMAIRLLLLAQHYRTAWDYTDVLLDEAQIRLQRWREAFGVADGDTEQPTTQQPAAAESAADSAAASSAARTIEQIRAALAQDLDTPAALVLIDRAATATDQWSTGDRSALGRAVDALLGIDLRPA